MPLRIPSKHLNPYQCLVATFALANLLGQGFAASGTSSSEMRQCISSLAGELPQNVSRTIASIDGPDRQLLALRSYLRNRNLLEARWSWSAEQIARYEGSAESHLVQGELASITRQFEASNPGYTLYVNSQVRSLDTQVRRWNENASVGAAAQALESAAGQRPPKDGCAGVEGKESFVKFLNEWHAPRTPTLAAPGLSKHGQARAFDFQVKRGALIVAGTDSASSISTWDRKGWTRKLRQAVEAASSHFAGPLQTPYEPWHYEYRP